ncbi:hypothetical protein HPB51_015078 [Rhipicephalus microplus]|uniref:Unconventional myosin-XV-like domain-containing protein n=1 Tax=Rhipicephalus microplus TaxID=6941 RepID=A0A9J6ETW1_RHIMP|nr:hypothetical protein HPB51_015078 [Rhipicephalus microplus]
MRDMASSRPPRASDRAGLGPPPPPPQHQQQQQQQQHQSILQQQQLPPRGGSVEDCAEFLQPVDEAPPPAPVVRARDNLKTRLYPPSSAPYITYTKVEWRIRIRKEVFQPGEQLQEPQALHLVFCQVVADAFGPTCIRLREDEAARLRALCDSLGVSPAPESRTRAPVQTQRSVVEAARDLPLYFSRMFPASGGRQLPDVHLVAVAHSGLRLVKRDPPGQLRVLETVRFEDIADVSATRPRTLQLLLRHGGWMTIYSPKAGHIQALVRRFVMEGTQEVPEYVQAVADYVTTESTLLSFREGELIRLVKQRCTGLAKAPAGVNISRFLVASREWSRDRCKSPVCTSPWTRNVRIEKPHHAKAGCMRPHKPSTVVRERRLVCARQRRNHVATQGESYKCMPTKRAQQPPPIDAQSWAHRLLGCSFVTTSPLH